MLMLKPSEVPDPQEMRTALRVWAFNTVKRKDPAMPADVRARLAWARRNSRPVAALSSPEALRSVLEGLLLRLDGTQLAPSVAVRRRKILGTCLEYAAERKLLPNNPIPKLKWKPPPATGALDRRRVVNPVQARALLEAVAGQGRWGGRMVAFYGCLYYAALRPEEAVALTRSNLVDLPSHGWGSMIIEVAEPHAGKYWTDTGKNRDLRGLKQRPVGDTREVPIPPPLTELLNEHLTRYGTAAGGRLFRGERNEHELPKLTIERVWRWTRREVFPPEVVESPLAATPYDLRHAAVSTWLNGGVPPTQVAEWAGHSVEVLLQIYAKCLDGGTAALRDRIEGGIGPVRDPDGVADSRRGHSNLGAPSA